MKALVVADEVEERLWTSAVHRLPADLGLVVGAGDLPYDYLEFLAGALDVPCVFVPGNHDPDLSGYTRYGGLSMKDGFPTVWPGPAGGVNADGRVVDVGGLRFAGLGGSVRYNDGPNQWTQRQQARRARRLVRRARFRRRRDGRDVDILLTHAPPRHCGDREDPPHRGFDCLHRTIELLRPKWLLHGHIHPHGEPVPDRVVGGTTVRNVVGHRIMEFS
ncbi:metallophosphoesterase [Amycolatopsis sp. WAC 01375]|uniref:metallophosphoesterase family protein n=1 Tax=unclassified Amycolatopsis TaxID=2618356 RepID=UPI000F787764|nr:MULTISPECIES: metallophosphoesterase [unclassified Amycolatopsis]RSM82960.1 metallophosphoesterase [Amycolatopsis sp. WAC 01375]RSN36286.1 metallophosphoesterase [Amycolatopsis sp. WAC 01416]